MGGRGLFPRPSRSCELCRSRTSASRAFLIWKVPAIPAASPGHGAQTAGTLGRCLRGGPTGDGRIRSRSDADCGWRWPSDFGTPKVLPCASFCWFIY
jgi:hypothetical protein